MVWEEKEKGCMHFPLFLNESIFHFTQGHCVLQTISISSSNTGENLPGNFIAFDSVPDRVGDGSALCVRYLCSGPCRLAVEVAVSTLRETNVVVFRRKWMSSASQVHRIRWLLVRWPPSILYQRDFFNRRELEARNATVRAQLDHLGEDGTHNGATLRIYKELPLPERLAKRAHVCLSWSAQVMWQITRDRPREQGQKTASSPQGFWRGCVLEVFSFLCVSQTPSIC